MLDVFQQHITTQFPLLKKRKLLIACSGGLDSVVLAHLCQSSNFNFGLAHCNYNLRGNESNGDQLFVETLATKMKRQVFVSSFNMDEHKKNKNSSIQSIARELRYKWFDSTANENGYDYILTAHHADDSLETFLINLSRGTGIKGLTGIPERNNTIIRPLLPFSRKEIVAFANTHNIKWREDSSNEETKYLRNKIRHEIIPNLKELQPNFLENFKLTQHHLSATSSLLHAYGNELRENLFNEKDGVISISVEQLKKRKPLKEHLHLILEPYGFTQWTDIVKLLDGTSGKLIYSKTHQLLKDREFLLLSVSMENLEKNYAIFEGSSTLDFPIKIKIAKADNFSSSSKNILFVDSEKLKYPLMLRKWNNGDYFYPLGMKGKKKLAKFFKDEKIDVLSKNNIWLLCSDNKIVWVMGKRADERFKVTEDTKEITKFELY